MIGDEGAELIARELLRLKRLDVDSCMLTDYGLIGLVASLTELTQLACSTRLTEISKQPAQQIISQTNAALQPTTDALVLLTMRRL